MSCSTRVMFVVDDGRRVALDVDERQLVGDVREKLRRALRLDSDEETSGSRSGRRKTLLLSFAGAVLDQSWRFADIGISPGAQVRVSVAPSHLSSSHVNSQLVLGYYRMYRPIQTA